MARALETLLYSTWLARVLLLALPCRPIRLVRFASHLPIFSLEILGGLKGNHFPTTSKYVNASNYSPVVVLFCQPYTYRCSTPLHQSISMNHISPTTGPQRPASEPPPAELDAKLKKSHRTQARARRLAASCAVTARGPQAAASRPSSNCTTRCYSFDMDVAPSLHWFITHFTTPQFRAYIILGSGTLAARAHFPIFLSIALDFSFLRASICIFSDYLFLCLDYAHRLA
jgi:hypothetical protein